ncbi:hypothetical protein [Alkalibacillus silvisoli]|uniref:Fimbrial assembly protein n=1 Tax=Alkalibacillus silvisoli TaxID=392823 RepID=A0ABN0ZK02_9BACI
MLVDINLLPQKETKSRKTVYTYSILVLFTLIVTVIFSFWVYDLNQEKQMLESELYQKEMTNADLQSEIEGDSEYHQSQRLQSLTDDIDYFIYDLSGVISELGSLVPTSGELQSFNYSGDTIDLTVQTATNEQAVLYYQDLSDLESFNEIDIHTINYIEDDDYYVTNYTVNLHQSDEEENDE